MLIVMAVMVARRKRVWPAPAMLAAIVAGGLVGQLCGNISFQWALGQIGLAMSVPLSLGGMILSAAILGRVFLFEPVTPKAALALGLLLAAIIILSLGADEASRAVAKESVPTWQLAAGVALACLSGCAYAVLNVVLRYCVTRGAPLPATLFSVSIAGMLSLGLIAWLRIGHAGMIGTSSIDFGLMLAAGVCNTAAFVALTKSLQLMSVVFVNALNATQATLAAIAGVVIFHEALSWSLAAGVSLTIAGLAVLAFAHKAMQEATPAV